MIDDTLKARASTHGDFNHNSMLAQHLKLVIRQGVNYNSLSNGHREALDMIAHKISRILAGDANYKDHWHDIGGYAKLGENACDV